LKVQVGSQLAELLRFPNISIHIEINSIVEGSASQLAELIRFTNTSIHIEIKDIKTSWINKIPQY